MCLTAYIWTKSRFLGLSLGVHHIGKGQTISCHPLPSSPPPTVTLSHPHALPPSHYSSPQPTGLWRGIHGHPTQCLCQVFCSSYPSNITPFLPLLSLRSILTYPWMEMGGKCHLECAQTGYYADIDFHCKVHWYIVGRYCN